MKLLISTKINRNIEDFTYMYSTTGITIHGIPYDIDKNICYILSIEKNIPSFFKIVNIICISNIWYFHGNVFIPSVYIENRHAYKVDELDQAFIIKTHELLDSHKIRTYKIKSDIFIYSTFDINNLC